MPAIARTSRPFAQEEAILGLLDGKNVVLDSANPVAGSGALLHRRGR